MYACRYFYSLMCPHTWGTGSTGTICIKRNIGISDKKKVAYPYYSADFHQGGQYESNQDLHSKPISSITEH